MARLLHAFKLVFFMAALAGCQKARMTHRQPVPQEPVVHVQPVPQPLPQQPLPVPQEPQVIPLPQIHEEDDKDIVIGPDPLPPVFHPSPRTPIPDNGRPLDENIFSQNQQRGVRPRIGNPNVVEWFSSGYIEPHLNTCGACVPEEHQCQDVTLAEGPRRNKIDILFVVDTSASLKEDRTRIAEQMGSFIDQLNSNVDYRIAVMPAHGPNGADGPQVKSSGNSFGELYSVSGSDPAVLKSSSGKASVIRSLQNKMIHLKTDRSYAQGEVGLLGLYVSLIREDLRGKMRSQGFLRDDAALAVIFVADENDACYDYRKGGTPNPNGTRQRDPVEVTTFERFCKLSNGEQLDPGHVLSALNFVKPNPEDIILTGIVYTSDEVPQKDGHRYAGEKEQGRGYLDLIELGGGQAVNLGDNDFGQSLAQLGRFSNLKMEFQNSFLCRTKVDPSKMDRRSFEITVLSPQGEELGYFSSACRSDSCENGVYPAVVRRDQSGRSGLMEVILNPDALSEIAVPSATVRMSFKTGAEK